MSVLTALSAVFTMASDATAVKSVRNLSAKIDPAQIAGDPQFDQLKGDKFIPERSYFSIRVAEMRLAEAGRYGIDFVPMCSCFLRFTYGAGQRTVPFVLGIDTIAAALGKGVSAKDARNIRFENMYIVRNVPVKADNLMMYSALCRIADSGFARGFINLFADAVGTLGGPVAGAAVKGGVDLTARLASLLGADGVQTRFGTLSGNALDESGYRVFAGIPVDDFDADQLMMRDGRLLRGGSPDGGTIDDGDYLVIAIEYRATLVDPSFGQVSILPFHQRWSDCREKLLNGDSNGAKTALSKLLIEVAASPDVTEVDRLSLITAYRAAFDQWSGAATASGALMGGTAKTPAARLTVVANEVPASVKPLVEAVRGGLTGATKRAGKREDLLSGADLAFLAERAHAVASNSAIHSQSVLSVAQVLPAIVATLSR